MRWLTLTVAHAPLLALLAGCAAGQKAELASTRTADVPPVLAEVTPALSWPTAESCRSLAAAVLAMSEEDRRRLPAESAPIAVAMADGAGLLPAEEVRDRLELDLPIPPTDNAESSPCLLLAAQPRLLPGGGRRLVGHETVTSEYRSSTRRQVNPEYRRLRAMVDEEEEGGGGGQVMRTGDPLMDLIGLAAGTVIRGVSQLRPAKATAAEQLGQTQRYIEEASFSPYTYEITSLEVGRVAKLSLALVDRGAGRALEVEQTIRERQVFPVAEGRHRADRGMIEGAGPQAVLATDVAVFETSAPPPKISSLLQALIDTPGEDRPATAAEILAAFKGPPTSPDMAGSEPIEAAAAPGIQQVVVETLSGPTRGMWLDDERIAVPASALGRSMLVQVTQPDGMITFGIVERVDKESGQAVIRVGQGSSGNRLPDAGLSSVLRDLKRH